MLRKARLWRRFADNIKRLKVGPPTVGRAMEPGEKQKLLRTAEGNPRRERALLATMLALNTAMRTGELKRLQWKRYQLARKGIDSAESEDPGRRARDSVESRSP